MCRCLCRGLCEVLLVLLKLVRFFVTLAFFFAALPIVFTMYVVPLLVLGLLGYLWTALPCLLFCPFLGLMKILRTPILAGFQTRLQFAVVFEIFIIAVPALYMALLPVALVLISIAVSFAQTFQIFYREDLYYYDSSPFRVACRVIRKILNEVEDITVRHQLLPRRIMEVVWDFEKSFDEEERVGDLPLRFSVLDLLGCVAAALVYFAVSTPIMLASQVLRTPLAVLGMLLRLRSESSFRGGPLTKCVTFIVIMPFLLLYTIFSAVCFPLGTVAAQATISVVAAAVFSAHGLRAFWCFSCDLVNVASVAHAGAFFYYDWGCCCCRSYVRWLRRSVARQWSVPPRVRRRMKLPPTPGLYDSPWLYAGVDKASPHVPYVEKIVNSSFCGIDEYFERAGEFDRFGAQEEQGDDEDEEDDEEGGNEWGGRRRRRRRGGRGWGFTGRSGSYGSLQEVGGDEEGEDSEDDEEGGSVVGDYEPPSPLVRADFHDRRRLRATEDQPLLRASF
jgi:hypothetical protein